MRIALLFLLLLAFAGQAVELDRVLFLDDCSEQCAGADSGVGCPLDCQACLCCAHPRPILEDGVVEIQRPVAWVGATEFHFVDPASPALVPLFHVPLSARENA